MVLKFAALCLAGVTRTEISQPCIARPVLRHVPVAACVVNRNFVILPYQNPQKGMQDELRKKILAEFRIVRSCCSDLLLAHSDLRSLPHFRTQHSGLALRRLMRNLKPVEISAPKFFHGTSSNSGACFDTTSKPKAF